MAVSLTAIQENIITLLTYSDQHCQTIRNLVEVEWWGGPYKILAPRIYEYIDRYKKAPKDHIADLMADKLESKKNREGDLYEDILLSIRDNHAAINTEYVIGQLEHFIRRQCLRSVAVDLATCLQADTDESLDRAEAILSQSNSRRSSVFNSGLRLGDTKRVLDFLESNTGSYPTGIPTLDVRGFGPNRKELWLYIAAAKRGKTWMLIQLAKMAVMHRLKVCHISLEMSEERSAQRYLQAFFAMSKRKEKQIVTKFEVNDKGHFADFDTAQFIPRLALDDPRIRDKLLKRITKFGPRLLDNIYIKQFPTGTLTVRQLIAYLDELESNERFIPDLLIVDYPDLMKLDKDNYRLAIDEIYKELRGIAVGRNMALAVVSQGNRKSEKAKNVGNDNVAEAWSKIAHADVVITYNQTEQEHGMGLARLFVSGGRNDEDKITIIVSQNYATGAFVYDSVLMPKEKQHYWDRLPKESDPE